MTVELSGGRRLASNQTPASHAAHDPRSAVLPAQATSLLPLLPPPPFPLRRVSLLDRADGTRDPSSFYRRPVRQWEQRLLCRGDVQALEGGEHPVRSGRKGGQPSGSCPTVPKTEWIHLGLRRCAGADCLCALHRTLHRFTLHGPSTSPAWTRAFALKTLSDLLLDSSLSPRACTTELRLSTFLPEPLLESSRTT